MGEIAYCGLKCRECPVYKVTQQPNQRMRQQLAEAYGTKTCLLAEEDMVCKGCHALETGESKMCKDCKIRNCGMKQDVSTCAECEAYPCGLIKQYVPQDSENRRRLDELAAIIKKAYNA